MPMIGEGSPRGHASPGRCMMAWRMPTCLARRLSWWLDSCGPIFEDDPCAACTPWKGDTGQGSSADPAGASPAKGNASGSARADPASGGRTKPEIPADNDRMAEAWPADYMASRDRAWAAWKGNHVCTGFASVRAGGMQTAPLPRRPLPRRAASSAASALIAPLVNDMGRGCRAVLKEDFGERSGLAGVLTVQAGCSDTSMPPAGVHKLVGDLTHSLPPHQTGHWQ